MPELDLAPPLDGLAAYMWRRLGHHLIEAGRAPDLRRLLLDPAWLQRKLDATDVGAVLADFDLLPGDEALTPVAAAIRLSAHVVGRDPSQLPSQLTGRLATIDVPEVQEFLARTKQLQSRSWLRPLHGGLTPPGAGQLASWRGTAAGCGRWWCRPMARGRCRAALTGRCGCGTSRLGR